ncbi:acyl-CoA dehydratase activase [Megasphaera sp. DJF_B143]|uniref:acyl-CoA dehydratase activase n=1 Tax=Megasphaera sp. DJF_B143 TaxID=537288 RepID=UPI00073E4A95|nr:acyl-CoA dehydratase activase [Megasphaera sp. DJF_B143]KUH56584.1 2-hydroxyglutaryl-CoA dehydratase [Megasphaera sp. DJF_B143]
MLTLGIDIGSTTSKAAIIENGSKIVAKNIIPVGTGTRGPEEVFKRVLDQLHIKSNEINRIVATGYGRMKFEHADRELSEISCHGKGVRFLIPDIRTIIDIGGQDAKVLQLNDKGLLENFIMNDKCAAGTGRFLDVMASVLDIDINDMGPRSLQADAPVSISSTCTVFAESEVISRLSNGENINNIIAGIHRSVAKKVGGLAIRLGYTDHVAMSGGVARNIGIVKAMEEELRCSIAVHPDCQLAGAIGAALFAYDDLTKK